ncbi:MAG: 3-hydroxybutyryl-CoA dehydrogenase, partial [Deltaproteobacteria bacterium]|nr:3-hydroxybutyryl-CoA dehydrogenase [Deltaproteobacteria bacterium]
RAEDIKDVLVIGSGIMGLGIAQNFAQAGLTVRVVDREMDILERCMAQIDANLKLFMGYGLLKEEPATVKARLIPYLTKDLDEAMKGCDFVVEAVPEIIELKKELFAKMDTLPERVILSSNTSSLTISSMAGDMRTPARVVGLHYFNPAHIIPAVEIHRGKHTSDEVVEVTRALMLRVGKKPVLVRKEVPGFIINRLTGAMEREIDYLLDEGVVTPEDLDTAVKASYGFRLACLGPMEAEDMIGLDTAARSSSNIFKVLSNKTEPSPQLLEKVNRGELGIKSGRGWYDYSGRSTEEIMDERNRLLLKQLALFMSRK